MMKQKTATKPRHSETLDDVVIRFAGDSGDGMQLTGSQFTSTTVSMGNDVSTLPDFPAEIRAPAGTLPGVSGYQIHFSSNQIYTPGDQADVLVAMNPAALKVNLEGLKPNGVIVANTDSFSPRDLQKAHYESNPLEDGSLDGYRLFAIDVTRLTRAALKESKLDTRAVDRCKNFFALGMMYYLYERPTDVTERWLEQKFHGKDDLIKANKMALRAGVAYCEATEVFHETYKVPAAKLVPGKYRNVSGNQALSLGLVAAAKTANLPLFLGSYPITPASDILHQLAGYKNYNVETFQAEDEIAGVCAAIGAAFAGSLGVTTTSGPGVALKMEAIGLAIMVELPLIIVNVQRGGPSTGLPTKTEQADLFQAVYGRNSESSLPVLAPATPADCFNIAFEAVRIALAYMTPVIILSDGYLANGAEPWKLPAVDELPSIKTRYYTDAKSFRPYLRDKRTLARPWGIPGTPGLEHRVGGLEKNEEDGNVSYDPLNHERMVKLRAEKVQRVAQDIPDLEVLGPESGKLLLVGWGSTYGAIVSAVRRCHADGVDVSAIHLRHLFPFPRNLGAILARFEKVLVPELNSGQLATMLRSSYLKETVCLSKIQGRPFSQREVFEKINQLLERTS
ncbi:MAG: 2-oxoacid:acceptor oxidoreductase subunit alpha [Acidobacteria bacterium]|nr:2-oxoacid:acceptor oxidoreductase subunit alpha [Acidobacteriota bacterium]MCZ6747207.1 2-oxoacid:acceptor oxidoreductase subunit alpha [Acidobacteriota bacterium]